MQTIDCEANASFSSTRSRSSTPIPARSSALRVAGTGPKPMIAGSTPATAVETTRASGFRPSSRARSASTSSTADAPSLMPGALPAVTVPPSRNAGRSFASASADVSARGCSSRVDDDRVALLLGHRDRDDLVVEPAGLDRRDRPSAATRARTRPGAPRSTVPALGDVLGGLAHRVRVVHRGERRVDEPPAERRVLAARARRGRRPPPAWPSRTAPGSSTRRRRR